MENKIELQDIQTKVKNCDISVEGANYYLLTLIYNELNEIKEFLINNNFTKNTNSINNETGVKNGK